MRPKKTRWVKCEPGEKCFQPQCKPLSKLKGVVLTIDEFEAIRLSDLEGLDQEKKVTFVALGTGREEQKIKERAKHLNLGDRFKFLGFRKDVGAILKRFDLFVMASKWEGLGTSILDAQSIGLPVIATNTGGIPEIVHDDLSGILVPPKNPEELAKSIIRLMHDKALRDRLSRCAISEVKKFSIGRVIDQNIELLRALSV